MRLKNILFLLLFSCITLAAAGQDELSKKERKKWKKKMKKMSPAEYKDLVEEKKSLKKQLTKQKEKNAKLKAKLKESGSSSASGGKTDKSKAKEGIIFKVQIGAFRDKDLMEYTDHPHFSGETDEGFKKYTLGRFEEYWEANKFKKYLREMGVKDAWIVAYHDGKRVSMKDALEGAVQ